MKKNKGGLLVAIGFIAAFVVLITVALLSATNPQGSSKSQSANSSDLNSLLNKPASDFTLEDYNGKKITLSSFKGKNVVLFFSEGLMCYPACWDQITAFGTDNDFTAKNTVVLTVVNDRKNDWKSAVDKMPELAKATVLFDTDKQVSIAYNMLSLPSSMHKGQLAGHTYMVIDKKGIVRFVLDDPQMAVRNQEILGEIDKLEYISLALSSLRIIDF